MARLSFSLGELEGPLFLGLPGWLEVIFGRIAVMIPCKAWWVPCGRHPIKPPRSLWLFWSFATEASRNLPGGDKILLELLHQCLNHLLLISDYFSSYRLVRVGL